MILLMRGANLAIGKRPAKPPHHRGCHNSDPSDNTSTFGGIWTSDVPCRDPYGVRGCQTAYVRSGEVEAKVLAVVDAIQRGQRVEDDLIECKREWPNSEKARQLAGSCNRARGHPVIYVIGIDEKDGVVLPLGSTDPSSWWPGISARFDGVAPDLETHLVVPLGSNEEVVALQFGTERAPYVVKNAAGSSPEREVPFRTGTSTRSAYRHEIIKMLGPVINLPTVVALSAEIVLRSAHTTKDAPYGVTASGTVLIYVEHLAPDFAMIPTHRIEAQLRIEGIVLPVDVRTSAPNWHPVFVRAGEPAPGPTPERRFGVAPRDDGLLITASGSARLYLEMTRTEAVTLAQVGDATTCEVSVALYADGSDVPMRIRFDASRDETDRVLNKHGELLFRA